MLLHAALGRGIGSDPVITPHSTTGMDNNQITSVVRNSQHYTYMCVLEIGEDSRTKHQNLRKVHDGQDEGVPSRLVAAEGHPLGPVHLQEHRRYALRVPAAGTTANTPEVLQVRADMVRWACDTLAPGVCVHTITDSMACRGHCCLNPEQPRGMTACCESNLSMSNSGAHASVLVLSTMNPSGVQGPWMGQHK